MNQKVVWKVTVEILKNRNDTWRNMGMEQTKLFFIPLTDLGVWICTFHFNIYEILLFCFVLFLVVFQYLLTVSIMAYFTYLTFLNQYTFTWEVFSSEKCIKIRWVFI